METENRVSVREQLDQGILKSLNLPQGSDRFISKCFSKISESEPFFGEMNYSVVNCGVSLRASSSANHSLPQSARYSGSRIKNFVNNQAKLRITAAHERAHAFTARALGGRVSKITIVPEGNSLGHTLVHANTSHSFLEQCRFFIATAFASTLGEEKMGHHDHLGTGGDQGMMTYYATLGANMSQGAISTETLLAQGKSLARDVMTGLSFTDLDNLALDLMDRKTI